MSMEPRIDAFLNTPIVRHYLTEYEAYLDSALDHCDADGLPSWFSERLFEFVGQVGNLVAAVEHVRYRLGCEDPARRWAAWEARDLARELSKRLSEGSYRPTPPKKRKIPKATADQYRVLHVPAVNDRYVGRAVHQIIRPLLLGHPKTRVRRRPGVQALLATLEASELRQHPYCVTQDFCDAFDAVPLSPLQQILCDRLRNRQVCTLAMSLVKTKSKSRRGIIQGCSLSPIFLDLYCDARLHAKWNRPELILRYVDDLVIPCRTAQDAEAAHKRLAELSTSAGMRLKYEREDAIVDLRCRPVRWLGFDIRLGEQGLEYHLPWLPLNRKDTYQVPPRIRESFSSLRAYHVDAWQVVDSVVDGWLATMAPAFPTSDVARVHALFASAAADAGFEICSASHSATTGKQNPRNGATTQKALQQTGPPRPCPTCWMTIVQRMWRRPSGNRRFRTRETKKNARDKRALGGLYISGMMQPPSHAAARSALL